MFISYFHSLQDDQDKYYHRWSRGLQFRYSLTDLGIVGQIQIHLFGCGVKMEVTMPEMPEIKKQEA